MLPEILLIFRMLTLLSSATPNESLENMDSCALTMISKPMRALSGRQGAPGFGQPHKFKALVKKGLDFCMGSCTVLLLHDST